MRASWAVGFLGVSVCLCSPTWVSAQSMRELGMSRSDFIQPEPVVTSPQASEPVSGDGLEGPVADGPRDKKRPRRGALLVGAGIGIAGVALEAGAALTVVVAYFASVGSAVSSVFTCGYSTHLDDNDMEHIVANECPETEDDREDFERRIGIAQNLAMAGGITLGVGALVAILGGIAAAGERQRDLAKVSRPVASLRPTLSFGRGTVSLGMALTL